MVQVSLPLFPSSRALLRIVGDGATVKNYTQECRALAQSMGLRFDVAILPEEDREVPTPRPPALGPVEEVTP